MKKTIGQGTIPSDWTGDYCRYAVCWPKSEQWLAVLRGVLTLPARGRFWDEHTGSILEAQSVIRETFDNNLHLGEVIMACNDVELIAAFADIATAIRYAADRDFAKAICCGDGTTTGGTGGYAGTATQPEAGTIVPIYGNNPPALLPPGENWPEGFTSGTEWDVHKCSIANLIFDGVIYTLAFLGSLTITNISVLTGLIGAGIAGILVFPPAGIVLMVGAIIALTGFLQMFLEIRDEMISQRQEFICAMYGAESVDAAIGILADLMDLVIALVTTVGPLGAAIKTVLLLLFNGDALNQLFDSTADYAYPDADCSGCVECEDFYWTFPTGLDGFSVVGALPACADLEVNGSLSFTWLAGIVRCQVTGGTPFPNGAFGQTGLNQYITSNTWINISLRTSGAGSLYIDFVLVFDDNECYWTHFSTNDLASGNFHGINSNLFPFAGKRVSELYIFMQSANAGPDQTFLTEINQIGFFCV